MHRVGRPPSALPCTTSKAVRLYTTSPPVKLRIPLKKWGDLVIPSRHEVNALKEKRATADINYLKFENEKSLAARLARPTIDITLARKEAQTAASVSDTTEDASKPPSEPTNTPEYSDVSVASTIEYMISQRREARLRRESEKVAQKQWEQAERAQYEALRIARVARRQEIELEKKAKAHSAINDFQPLNQQLTSLKKAADPAAELRREKLAKLAAGLAEKRKLEREKREKEQMESGQLTKKVRTRSHSPSYRPSVSESMEEIELSEEGGSGDFLPQFTGPEPTSLNLSIFKFSEIRNPTRKGDYSHYVPQSPEVFSTPPDELGAVQVAGVVLSHRRDVSLTQRQQSLELIRKALARKPVSKPQVAP